jgi:hypothetical protein
LTIFIGITIVGRIRVNRFFPSMQTLLVDLELWLTETQAAIAAEIKLTSVQVVKEQIRASQVRKNI